jgi:hypothetical protein
MKQAMWKTINQAGVNRAGDAREARVSRNSMRWVQA